MPNARLVLASASPRRAALLRQVGLEFEALAADVDESVPPGVAPAEAVATLARRKASAAAERSGGAGAWVLGADTLGVAPDGALLGKPRDAADAEATLARLSGVTHRVLTGVCVVRAADGAAFEAVEETRVTFARLSRERVRAYVATGEPLGKAGAYAIQGLGGALVTRIEGDYGNVVGLPLAATVRLLAEAAFPLPAALEP